MAGFSDASVDSAAVTYTIQWVKFVFMGYGSKV